MRLRRQHHHQVKRWRGLRPICGPIDATHALMNSAKLVVPPKTVLPKIGSSVFQRPQRYAVLALALKRTAIHPGQTDITFISQVGL